MHVFLLHGKVHAARRASGLCPVMFCFVGSCGFVGFVGAPASGLVVVTLVSLPCLSHRWTTGSGCGSRDSGPSARSTADAHAARDGALTALYT